jgi:hypothetical protein
MIETNILEQTTILKFADTFTKQECKTVSDEILKYKQQSEKHKDFIMNLNSNKGCWMGMPHKNKGFSNITESLLVTKLLECAHIYRNSLPRPKHINNLNLDYLDTENLHIHAWCNVNDPDSENFIHCHPGNLFSGVAYFQAENTGSLEFVPTNYIQKTTHPAWPFHGTAEYHPNDGDVLIFPSYLMHQVNRNTSTKQRITLAFDISLAEK